MTDSRERADGIRLRQVRADDAEVIFRWRSEPSARTHQPLRQVSIGDLRQMLAARGAAPISPSAEGDIQWVIETPLGPAGWVTLTINSREHGLVSLGYTIGERFRGRGYATAAVSQVIHIAFDPSRLDLWRLEAVATVDNVASRRVLEQNGFVFEGIARAYLVVAGKRVDHARYALLRSEWNGTIGLESETKG